MKRDPAKVILFPVLQENLEQESKLALEAERYPEALEKLDELLSYGVDKREVYVGKLMCLMELDRNEEAMDLCEMLLERNDKHYYYYAHIYLTVLFQSDRYEELMWFIDDILTNHELPKMVRVEFEKLYDMSRKLNIGEIVETAKSDMDKLKQVINTEAYHKQWEYIGKLRQADVEMPKDLYQYLQYSSTHPMVATALFEWLQDQQVEEKIEITKLGETITVVPKTVPTIEAHPFFSAIRSRLDDIEQDNPSLFQLLNQLLYRYTYVNFPVLDLKDTYSEFAKALILVGRSYLSMPIDDGNLTNNVRQYMRAIQECEAIYLSILEN